MAFAMMILPLGEAIAKEVTSVTLLSAGAIAWSRFVVGSALVVPIALGQGAFRGLGRGFVARQALRGLLLSGVIYGILQAVTRVPLADAFGAFFIGPSLATLLAALLLREKVGRLEWGSVVLGFLGVLLVLRPTGEVSPGLVWALGSGTCFAGFLIATRWAVGSAPPIAQLAGQLVTGAIVLAAVGLPDFLAAGLPQWGWILAMGLISSGSNLMQLLAFRHAGAAYLAPLAYTQLFSATLLGWAVFGDLPDTLAFIGLAVILGAGLMKLPWQRITSR